MAIEHLVWRTFAAAQGWQIVERKRKPRAGRRGRYMFKGVNAAARRIGVDKATILAALRGAIPSVSLVCAIVKKSRKDWRGMSVAQRRARLDEVMAGKDEGRRMKDERGGAA
jgi:hypothetical protein